MRRPNGTCRVISDCVIYDTEIYPNVFTCVFFSPYKNTWQRYEISARRNDTNRFCRTLRALAKRGARLVGFNNIGFDYPLIHGLLQWQACKPNLHAADVLTLLNDKANAIIESEFKDRFAHVIPEWNWLVQQLDLQKVHHFDNKARLTSLKQLEFNMRSPIVEDLPFEAGTPLTEEQIEELLEYNENDVLETWRFFDISKKKLDFRNSLTKTDKSGADFSNYNDTKIGKMIFQRELETTVDPEICYYKEGGKGRRKMRQTHRSIIHVGEILSDKISFRTPEFQAIHGWLKCASVPSAKMRSPFSELSIEALGDVWQFTNQKPMRKKTGEKLIKDLHVVHHDVEYIFGGGGLHACNLPGTYQEDDKFAIIDVDVVSYYPSLAIVNRFYPKHLTEAFCDVYERLKERRVSFAKGTVENAALKLALNGVYGDSNNVYSPFYDPQYTLSITVNGQLMLCMLAESLTTIPDCTVIQANTDGVTVKVPRDYVSRLRHLMKDWEAKTGLELEEASYRAFYARDVNNYAAQYKSGDMKRKGAYEYELDWNKNFSTLVIQKAVEAHLTKGTPVREFLENHEDDYDFFYCAKCPRTSRITLTNLDKSYKIVIRNLNRVYVSKSGHYMTKVMPPLKKKPGVWREISILKDTKVKVCNNTLTINRDDLDYDWYEAEVMKLLKPFETIR